MFNSHPGIVKYVIKTRLPVLRNIRFIINADKRLKRFAKIR